MNEVMKNARVIPTGRMEVLSKAEVNQVLYSKSGNASQIYQDCSLAVLNSGSYTDDGKALLERFKDFKIDVVELEGGIELELHNAPASAFVDGEIIAGIGEHLFAVLRDVIYTTDRILGNPVLDLDKGEGITSAIFHMLRNANVLQYNKDPKLVVCWGGHAISRPEYDYTKEVGYELGLRHLDTCTGCGPGAMKGPMKGATIAHAKQRNKNGRYIGITEPGIIAAESPNPIVNHLVIMPDIEKRLEAFVRLSHGIIVFPGGVGTTEEILYLLGILSHPDNQAIPFPLIFTGPESSEAYFQQVDEFLVQSLGEEIRQHYEIIIDDPVEVARTMHAGIQTVKTFREENNDAFYFNWSLKIAEDFQYPFKPTHENMRDLNLDSNQPVHEMAANLRRAFSGVVAGNVKAEGIRAVEEHGLYELNGDPALMQSMDGLMNAFIEQGRMKIEADEYKPCYTIKT